MKLFKHRSPKFDNAKLLKEIDESKKIKRTFLFIVGILLLSLSFNIFVKQYHLISGVSGISVITEKLLKLDPSLVILIGNVLLLIASYVFLDKEKARITVIGSILYPVFIKLTDFTSNYIKFDNTETIVLVLCGAFISGIGTGLIFKNNFNSGGTDVLKQILTKYFKVPYSTANIYSEGLIMIFGGLVFGWTAFLYTVIYLIISGIISDRVIMGISEFKTLQIVTSKDEEIKEFILKNLNHGMTEIDVKGGYTNENKKVLLCAVPTREYFLATEGIKKLDPDAFVIAIDTYEIQGN